MGAVIIYDNLDIKSKHSNTSELRGAIFCTDKFQLNKLTNRYLTFRRSPWFALAYASNDIVLIVLWIMASLYDTRYISVVVCFLVFLINDVYGYINWHRMKERQNKD